MASSPITKKVLMLTLSSYGQANCHLAVAHELLQREAEVHFASFKVREKTVVEVSRTALLTAPTGTPPIYFHEIHGAHADYDAEGIPFPDDLIRKPMSFRTSMEQISLLVQKMTTQWPDDNFVNIYNDIIRIMEEVKPDMIAVDVLFGPAIAACQHTSNKYMILSPNTIKDFSVASQPGLRGLWKSPMICTGYSYPVPWHLIPCNIFFLVTMIVLMVFDPPTRSIKARMKRETGKDLLTTASLQIQRPPDVKVLVGNCLEIDFQPITIPADILPCGPIICATTPLVEVDSELDAWLSQAPTILVNLGTFFEWKEDQATEMALALQYVIQTVAKDPRLENVQVLWKLKPHPRSPFSIDTGSTIYQILSKEIISGRVRIVPWLIPTPMSILESGKVVVCVNHGGANSFNESTYTGTPQVVLPNWLDCYDYAERAEFLGIGVHGSKKTQPRLTAEDLGPKIASTIMGPFAEKCKKRCQELQKVLQNGRHPGRIIAAEYILDAAQ
ncbi:hypothetical protein BX600DRAFT_382343 [Xylariales sp. PMI_506]|nr:hypothetical protein BX600DRAFT_382343 [Xylariales sp. PMI_506]